MRNKRIYFYLLGHRATLLFFAFSVVVTVTFGSQPRSAPPPTPNTTLDEVSEKLSCRCGCNLVLNRCNHVQCGSAIPLRERINKEIAEGKTREEIIAGFVGDMGEQVLAVPPTSGFNWNAWIMPFAMLGAGGIVLGIALKVMRRRKPGETSTRVETATPEVRNDLDSRIEKELKEFEE